MTELPVLPTIEIHTSDRGTFKRCRRKFGWASTIRDNLVRIGPEADWSFIGTGIHFALEDWWGWRRFEHPALAFAAYYDAFKKNDLPDNAEADLDLAVGMLEYYADDWLTEHPETFKTLWIDGSPQVEVEVAIDLNDLLLAEIDKRRAELHNFDHLAKVEGVIVANQIVYVSTYDRVVVDKHDNIMGLDYKSAASFDELNLMTNPQAGAYDWSMDLFYSPVGYTPLGIIWQQHKKSVPRPPKLVYVGTKRESFSMDASQPTTHRLYKKAVLERYGTIPEMYNDILSYLANAQDYNGDAFVRRDTLKRNPKQREAEQERIVQEVLDMLDPDLPLYPNFTKDCKWDCAFRVPCLAKDEDADVAYILEADYTQWQGYKDDWRARVVYPAA